MVESHPLPTCHIPEQSKAGATSGCLVADALIGGDIVQAVKDEGVAWGKGEKAHLQTRRMYQPFLTTSLYTLTVTAKLLIQRTKTSLPRKHN